MANTLLPEQMNKIAFATGALGFLSAAIFGFLYFQKPKVAQIPVPTAAIIEEVDTLDGLTARQEEALETALAEKKETLFIKTIDSLKTVIEEIETAAEENSELPPPASDYLVQMLDYAKKFEDTDCNKSLAFLYAAKKIASSEGRTGTSVKTIQTMINKCEENIFGKKPSAGQSSQNAAKGGE